MAYRETLQDVIACFRQYRREFEQIFALLQADDDDDAARRARGMITQLMNAGALTQRPDVGEFLQAVRVVVERSRNAGQQANPAREDRRGQGDPPDDRRNDGGRRAGQSTEFYVMTSFSRYAKFFSKIAEHLSDRRRHGEARKMAEMIMPRMVDHGTLPELVDVGEFLAAVQSVAARVNRAAANTDQFDAADYESSSSDDFEENATKSNSKPKGSDSFLKAVRRNPHFQKTSAALRKAYQEGDSEQVGFLSGLAYKLVLGANRNFGGEPEFSEGEVREAILASGPARRQAPANDARRGAPAADRREAPLNLRIINQVDWDNFSRVYDIDPSEEGALKEIAKQIVIGGEASNQAITRAKKLLERRKRRRRTKVAIRTPGHLTAAIADVMRKKTRSEKLTKPLQRLAPAEGA